MKLQLLLGDYNMKVMKIALLGTAALVAASISARADALDSLKASINDMNVNAVADAPAAAAPATVVTWGGWVRAGIGTKFDATGGIGAVAAVAGPNPAAAPALLGAKYATDIWAQGELQATAKTQTAVGEVGVNVNLRSSPLSQTFGVANGSDASVRTDDFQGWWKMTPNLTLSGGQQGTLVSSYSWDAVATNWFYGGTQTSILGLKNGNPSDPTEMMLAYADGPLGFAVQVYDGGNVTTGTTAVNGSGVSAFGVDAKASYKMDAIGFDIGGAYVGNAAGPFNAWSVFGGLGYSAGPFSIGAALATGSNGSASGSTTTPGSIQAKFNLSDAARIEMGVTRDFLAAGNPTTYGAGLYYSPAKQITLGLEGAFQSNGLGAASGDGSYTAGIVTSFSF